MTLYGCHNLFMLHPISTEHFRQPLRDCLNGRLPNQSPDKQVLALASVILLVKAIVVINPTPHCLS